MKKLVLALLLAVSVASAEGMFKNLNQFKQDCQNKNAHFYTCKFFNLQINQRLNAIEQEMIEGYYLAVRNMCMYLDTIHNKKIETYFTQSGKRSMKEEAKLNEDKEFVNDAKNNPDKVYNFVLWFLNDEMKKNGIELK